jgi:hypothetical protein
MAPTQTLEDVLLMALKGADPYQLELLLRKRGDYRPHAEFGINLSIPWSAGTKEAPSYDVRSAGSEPTRPDPHGAYLYSSNAMMSWRAGNQCQSVSIKVDQCQSVVFSINQC